MRPHPSAWLWLVPLAGIVTHASLDRLVLPRAEAAPARIVVNDNRSPAGTLRGGVLALRLEARLGDWHPDGEDAIGATVPAFAEAGHPARIPGPLIRVPAGTDVALSIHNSLTQTLTLHGLHDRRRSASSRAAAEEVIALAPGATRAIRFRLDAPGTYYYYGSTRAQTVEWRAGEDAQLSGAIVVDPAGAGPAHDRVFVIGIWSDTAGRAFVQRKRILAVINGRSWPQTERLNYSVGDSVRWHVINASADSHPMHLHGFYYRVDERGDGEVDTVYADDQRRRVNTENVNVGSTMTMTWVPERPGNWLFHCHLPDHFRANGSLGMARTPGTPRERAVGMRSHALSDMNGLILGVTVRGTPMRKAIDSAASSLAIRDMRLLIRPSAGGSAAQPYYTFSIVRDGAEPAPDSGLHVGPPLVLQRGEPVRITVVNALDKPTTVHWHGIELDSYFDGVAGFSGAGQRLAPVIAPNDSFVARFTPPRAGTFIYHTHVDETIQQLAGLAGPLIVLDSGRTLDSTTDHPILITTPPNFQDEMRSVLLNGSASPEPTTMRAGVAHRLRFINMTLRRPGARIQLMRDTTMLTWRPLAKDGADLPPAFRTERPARSIISIGETMDYEIVPMRGGRLRIEVTAQNGVVLGTMPIEVTGAPADSSGTER